MSVSDAAQRANQNQASAPLAPCLHNEPFFGPEGKKKGGGGVGGAGTGGGGPCGSLNKVGYRSVAVVGQTHPEQESPYIHVRQFIISIATSEKKKKEGEKKSHLHSFGDTHMSFICKCVITSNLQSQITTREAGRGTSGLLKTKHINLRGRGRRLDSEPKSCTASSLLICRTAGKQTCMS